MLKENDVDPKQEVPEYEEKSSCSSRVPAILRSSLLPSKDCNSDPGALDNDFIEDTEADRDSELKEEEEDFYNGEKFYQNC